MESGLLGLPAVPAEAQSWQDLKHYSVGEENGHFV